MVVYEWQRNGIPEPGSGARRSVSTTIDVETILETIRKVDLTPQDVERIVAALKTRGIIESAVVKAGPDSELFFLRRNGVFFKQNAKIARYLKAENGNNAFKELRRVLDDVLEECNRGMSRWSLVPLQCRVFAGLNGPILTKQQSDQTITKGELEIARIANVNRIQFSALLPPQKNSEGSRQKTWKVFGCSRW